MKERTFNDLKQNIVDYTIKLKKRVKEYVDYNNDGVSSDSFDDLSRALALDTVITELLEIVYNE